MPPSAAWRRRGPVPDRQEIEAGDEDAEEAIPAQPPMNRPEHAMTAPRGSEPVHPALPAGKAGLSRTGHPVTPHTGIRHAGMPVRMQEGSTIDLGKRFSAGFWRLFWTDAGVALEPAGHPGHGNSPGSSNISALALRFAHPRPPGNGATPIRTCAGSGHRAFPCPGLDPPARCRPPTPNRNMPRKCGIHHRHGPSPLRHSGGRIRPAFRPISGHLHPRSMRAICRREHHQRRRNPMVVKVAINGFGRIGRNVLRAIIESGRNDIEVGDQRSGSVETNAHLLRYDPVHGRFPATVTVNGDLHRRAVARSRSPRSATRRNCLGRCR